MKDGYAIAVPPEVKKGYGTENAFAGSVFVSVDKQRTRLVVWDDGNGAIELDRKQALMLANILMEECKLL